MDLPQFCGSLAKRFHAPLLALAVMTLGTTPAQASRIHHRNYAQQQVLTTARYTHLTSHTNDQMGVRIEAFTCALNPLNRRLKNVSPRNLGNDAK